MAAAGAVVRLDGGTEIPVDAEGRFVLSGVAPGAHTLDAAGTGFVDGTAPVEVAVYPGARVVIGLDPVPAGSSDGGEATTDDGSLPDPEGSTGATATASGGGDLPGDDPSGETGGGDDRALPPGFGEGDGSGCGCAQGDPTPAWALSLWLLAGLAPRRRDRHGPPAAPRPTPGRSALPRRIRTALGRN
jgi:uncharacterized protein (TIGR03382 family)